MVGAGLDVAVGKAIDQVLPGQGCPGKGKVFLGYRVQPGVAFPLVRYGPAVAVENAAGIFCVGDGSDGFQVAPVGGPADLGIAGQVHALSHRAPDAVAVLYSQDAELGGVVGSDLHAGHIGHVVTLDRVAAPRYSTRHPSERRWASLATSGARAGWSLHPRKRSTSSAENSEAACKKRLGRTASRAPRERKATSVGTSAWSTTQRQGP